MHPEIAGYGVGDMDVVAAFDIDARKVGRPLHEAIFALPNNAKVFCREVSRSSTLVSMGPVLDGVAEHMKDYPPDQRFVAADLPAAPTARVLREAGAQILVNYMPVGAQRAAEHYAEACLEAGVALVNCVPCFIVSDAKWAQRFARAQLPCVGDDVKSQLGATITHRMLARLFSRRGMRIDATYQLNTGGNTDFLNMLASQRLASKRLSKTQAVQSQLDVPLDARQIHIGPSDYVAFQKDNKVCFLRIEATGFGGLPMNLELRLSVEDSPNSAGVVVDAIRCCQAAREAHLSGPIPAVCAWTMKHPPRQMTDDEAGQAMDDFIDHAASRSQTAHPKALA
jgi:myo-inositol-1-phosphate synthase